MAKQQHGGERQYAGLRPSVSVSVARIFWQMD